MLNFSTLPVAISNFNHLIYYVRVLFAFEILVLEYGNYATIVVSFFDLCVFLYFQLECPCQQICGDW